MTGLLSILRRFTRRDAGSVTVEFVIAVPFVLTLLFSSVDFGAVMLRQVFLDRSVDIAVRQIRLGAIGESGHQRLREMICDGTLLMTNCINSITVEMRPVDTETWAGLEGPAQCVNREEDIAPILEFDPGAGRQELMLVRVCVASDPFLAVTGMVMGMPQDASGAYHTVSISAFANEPT